MVTNILTYIDGNSSVENAATAAFLLATRHNARVEGLFVRTDVSDVIPNTPIYAIDGALPLVEQYVRSCDRETAQTEQRAKEAFAQTRDQLPSLRVMPHRRRNIRRQIGLWSQAHPKTP